MKDRNFGTWLAAELSWREMTPADFARQVPGLSTGRLSEWLNNKRQPTLDSIKKVAQALHLEEEDVLIGMGYLLPRDDPMEPQRAELMSMLRRVRLTPEHLDILRNNLLAMLREDLRQGQRRGQERG